MAYIFDAAVNELTRCAYVKFKHFSRTKSVFFKDCQETACDFQN